MSDELSRTWAENYSYPFDDVADLSRVMQYAFVVEQDAVHVKHLVTAELSRRDAPDFSDPTEPHALLARYPISVYLTTNYDDYMTRALLAQGKRPTTALCPWYRDAATRTSAPSLPRGYKPSSQSPLVYHLHGSFEDPASLVIGEEDYVEFLLNMAMDGMNDQRIVPMQLLPALTRQPLLFIGYSLHDWTFRLLFYGLVRAVVDVLRRRHVSVQLPPPTDDDPRRAQRAQDYLTAYFERLNISVYWGSASDFCSQLAYWLEEEDP